jgi:uncharacterized protein
MNILDALRNAVNAVLLSQANTALQTAGWVHLYAVSQAAALLAMKRSLNADVCAAAGLLHDIHTYRTAEEADHARHGSVEAGGILRGAGGWAEGDIAAISGMILHHSDKQAVDSPLDECLKDADVFAHWLNDMSKKFDAARKARLDKIMAELRIAGIVMQE